MEPEPKDNELLGDPRTRAAMGVDLRGLAFLRISLGVLILLDLWNRIGDLGAHYTDQGILSRALLAERYVPYRLSLHTLSGEAWFAAALMAVAAVFAVFLILGLRTRLVTAVCWLLLLSLHHRNPTLLNRGDVILGQLLFWALLLPVGARASLDARRSDEPAGPNLHVSLPALGLLLQMFSIYVFSAFFKSFTSWTDGSAVHDALNIDVFATSFGHWVLGFPLLVELLGRSVLWLELVGPWLIFVPLRAAWFRGAAVVMFVGFHMGLAATMELGLFPFVCAAAWIAILPGPVWDRVEGFAPLTRARAALDGLAARLPRRLLAGRPRTPGWLQVFAGLVAVYLLIWNVASLPGNEALLPRPVRIPGDAVGLHQRWNMFAPYPLRSDGWYVIPAELEDGSVVDLYTGRALTWDKPALVSATFRTQRWRKLMSAIWARRGRWLARPYADWLRREWDAEHPGRRVASLQVCYMLEMTRRDKRPARAYPTTLYRWWGDGRRDELYTYAETRAAWSAQVGDPDG